MTRPWALAAPGADDARSRRRGQGVVEFAILVPAFMILLFAMLEFGFVFSHHLTLEYATREGARVGAALGSGPIPPCGGAVINGVEPIDWQIIAAVQRVLTSPGSQVPPGQVSEIRIYKADTNGNQVGTSFNSWVPSASGDTSTERSCSGSRPAGPLERVQPASRFRPRTRSGSP